MKLSIIIVIIAVAGILLLGFAGKFLISEVVSEVAVEKREEITDARIGKLSPYFELPDLNGPKVKSTDFLEKPIVIIFWASWNEESANQIKILDDYLPKHRSELFEILTISSQEDKSAVLNFMLRGNYKVKVLLDESGEITEKYGARSLPAAYFADKDGQLRYIHIGALSESGLVEKAEKLLK